MNMNWDLQELWHGLTFSVPLSQVVVIVGFITLCMIWGRYKLGTLMAFFSFFYWGYLANRSGIMNFVGESSIGIILSIFIVMSMSFLVLFTIFEDNN